MNSKTDLEKLKKNFDKNGFVTINNFFNKTKIKNLKKNLFNFIEKNEKNSKKKQIHYAKGSKKINSIHNLKWPYIKKLRDNKNLRKIVEKLISDKLKNFGAEVFAKPPKVGLAVPIHQDNYYWNVDNSKGVTIWLALDKCTKKNGALFYYSKSQKLGILKHKSSFVPGSSQTLNDLKVLKKFKKTTPALNIGDILIHHCLVIHGSDKNNSNRSRVGLTVRYIGKSSKINQSAKLRYEKSLKKQLV